jgi:xanthine/uracil permease
MFIYAMQWFVLAVAVVSTSVFVAQGSPAERLFFAQKLFAVIGITGVIQVLWGHRMPLVVGPASVLLVGVLSSLGAEAPVGAIYTSIAIGGVLILLLSFGGLMSRVRKLFTPRIVVVILMLIAFTLSPVIKNLIFPDRADAEQHLFGLVFSLVGSVGIVILNRTLKGVAKSLVVPIALIVGSVAYYALFPMPQGVETTGVIGGQILNDFSFDWSLVIAFVICYIALLINDIGSIQGLGAMLQTTDTDKRCRRGVGITGIFNIIAGSIGIIGPVNFSMSPGVIGSSLCASRYALIPAGAGLVVCALSPSLIALFSAIPNTVIGVILLYLMGTQLAASFHIMTANKSAETFDDGLIVGLPIMVAILFTAIPMEAIPQILRPIMGNGFVMGTLSVMILEHIIFRKPTLKA